MMLRGLETPDSIAVGASTSGCRTLSGLSTLRGVRDAMANADRKPELIYCTTCHASEPMHPGRNGYACERTLDDGSKCTGKMFIWREYRRRTRPPGPAQVIT